MFVVHVLDPGDELIEVTRLGRLGDAVDGDPVLHRALGQGGVAARQDVHVDVAAVERLGDLAHVAGESAFDDRRVLPGEDEETQGGFAVSRQRARPSPDRGKMTQSGCRGG